MDRSKRAVLVSYLKALADVAARGDAREESFYPALADLIREIARAAGRPHIQVTIQPRPTEAGNPDFRVWDGRERIIGYLEAKRPAEEILDRVEDSDQFRHYRDTFPNLILTNFLEFRLYRNGERVEAVRIGQPKVLYALRTAPPVEHAEELWALLVHFLDYSLPPAFTAESLAVELAKRARFLRNIVLQQLEEERQNGGALRGFYEAFQKYLMGTLTEEAFADLYAQTITYGLFAARTRTANGFNRRNAFHAIPRTIGVLRDLFRYISLGDLPPELEWIVDDIAHVLAVADVSGILSRNRGEGSGSDPIVYFYEPFLARYNPEERERRGVYYTPEQVVSYIVRSLHRFLKDAFQIPDGLASGEVTLLDPAAGTMTFVARAAWEAVQEFERKYGSGARAQFIRDHILRNFYAFELMVAPYAVGHLKMGFFLEELGYPLAEDERVPFYLTNTLDVSELERSKLPGLSSLAEESRLAGRVKRDIPILVILGNPPYSGHSANQGDWIRNLIGDYKQVDGKPLGEKNPKWLQDDYVKFLRFAEWKIAQAGRGVVGMITNHSYLDNPTFRGMRQHLMQTFDEIYVLNLHGNSLKRETCPDGSKDENVFDIRQGVAIAFFVKRGKTPSPSPSPHAGRGETPPPFPLPACGEGETPPPFPLPVHGEGVRGGVYHADLWGLREQKYAWLETHDVASTPWQKVHPEPPFYLFVPRDERLGTTYHRYPAVPTIFPVNSVGIVTARDRLTIHWTPDGVWTTVLAFSRMDPELAREAYHLGNDAQDWKVAWAQDDLKKSGPSREYVVPILYRPFDIRYTYYTGRSRGFICRSRSEVMRHMLAGENVALIVPRRVEHAGGWQHVFVTDRVSEHVAVSLKTIDYHFPLYLYPTAGAVRQGEMFEGGPSTGGGIEEVRRPNLNLRLVRQLEEGWGIVFEPGQPHPRTPSPYTGRGWGEGASSRALDGSAPEQSPPHPRTPSPPAGRGLGEGFSWRTPPSLWERLKPIAREMRQDPTPAEERLWELLRRKQLYGYKFRRQHAIERFVVDFYCHDARLIVEVDGPVHQYTPEEDAVRQEFLESLGYKMLRFTNEQVMSDPGAVLETIAAALPPSREQENTDQGKFTPEDIFCYVYAVLYAPTYREKYAEFLRLDFPRIPFPADPTLFAQLADLGQQLVNLHLLRSPGLDLPLARFEGQGDHRVGRGKTGVRYDCSAQQVYINATQYFAPVPPDVWEYRVGGYQVCEKWLKDRAERALSLDEVRTYCRIVTALEQTIHLQGEIDALYCEVEENPLPIGL